MDIYGLVITHIRTELRPVRMNAWAEDRYYSTHMGLRRFRPGPFESISMAAGLILMLGITLI
ncbi:hypothetical protein GOZ90_26500 [Agrobacterium vitis]|uniref:Uncharacterized protein n=1 Tax=Agrobacterium vitis TaxID=373 RepID=A0A6L6VMR5_AGRVI|nr:hypothetical protein [Agrobacterium vitis]MUZ76188.1 hypothetical protein [Agrobacterium vitis]